MAKNKKEIEFSIWIAGMLLLVFTIIMFALERFTAFSFDDLMYGCWVHKRSGLYCPGCGGTRAFFAIMRGDIFSSFLYHPLVPYMGIIYLVFMVRGLLHVLSKGKLPFMKYRIGYIYVGIALTIVQFLIKNICLIFFHFAWLA